MIVECPSCTTRFRLNAERVRGSHPPLKCSQCGYVFSLPGPKKQPASKPPRERPRDREDKQLTLGGEEWSLGEPAEKEAEVAESKTRTPSPDRRGASDDSASLESAADPLEGDEADGVEGEELKFDEDLPPSRSVPEDEALEEDDAYEDEPEAPEIEHVIGSVGDVPEFALIPEPEPEAPRHKPKRPSRPAPRSRPEAVPRVAGWLSFLALVAGMYALVAFVFLSQPAVATRVLANFGPFADLSEKVALGRAMGIEGVRATYQRIKEDRREGNLQARQRKTVALVLAGDVRNGARQSVRDIRIRGRLLGREGEVLAEKEVYCGAAISPEVLAATDSFGVSVLERMQPPPRFQVSPGTASGFAIAFVDPPDGVENFAVEVLAAHPAQL